MKVLVIVVHPDLEKSRVNQTWINALQGLEDVTVHPLYQTYPDGLIDVKQEQALLQAHDRIVIQFPFYWYSAPYFLHLWQQQVLTYGWAYGPGGNKLAGKEIMLAVSTGGPASAYQAGGHNNFSMSELLKPYQQMSNLVGAKYLSPFLFHGAGTASQEQIAASAQPYAAWVQAGKGK